MATTGVEASERTRTVHTGGLVFNIQRYSLHDGPGIRTTVFLKGCPLHCLWCHNPESIAPRREVLLVAGRCMECAACRDACPLPEAAEATGPLAARMPNCLACGRCVDACPTRARQMVGRERTARDVAAELLKDRMFYESSGGGVTVSGGEPLGQAAFARDLMRELQQHGVHTALDTTGFGRTADLLDTARHADLVLYDLKAMDDDRHRRLTGVSNRIILENLRQLDRVHKNIWIRLPVVPGYNDDLHNLRQTGDFITGLRHITLVNLLPFHRNGIDKFQRLGQVHALAGVDAPGAEFMERAAMVFRDLGLETKIGG